MNFPEIKMYPIIVSIIKTPRLNIDRLDELFIKF